MKKSVIRLGKLVSEWNAPFESFVEALIAIGYKNKIHPNSLIDKQSISSIEFYFNHRSEILLICNNLKSSNYFEERNIKSIENLNSIYKYFKIDNNLIDSLTNNYLFHSCVNDFNDPFDNSVNLITVNKGFKNMPQRNFFKQSVIEQIKKFGVCCFSSNKQSTLMWSHYADKHRGICIEYDVNLLNIELIPVVYKNEFEKPDIVDSTDEAIKHLIYTKAEDWKYENEYRSIRILPNENSNRKISYNTSAIKSIYFGVKTSDEDIRLIKELIQKTNSKIKCYYGELSQNQFSIDWKRI